MRRFDVKTASMRSHRQMPDRDRPTMSEQMSQEHSTDTLKIIVYSDDRTVREQIRLALGRKIASDLPQIEIFEFATYAAALKSLDETTYDGAVFDGEAVPGGMGLTHQMKEEIASAPPVVLLIARMADAWLAAWSKAEAISAYPVDPIRLPDDLARVIRERRDGIRNALHADYVAPGIASRHGA